MDDRRLVEKRLAWLAGVILIWCAVILVRLVLLQVVRHQDYLRMARKAQEIEVKIPALRGSLFDAGNRLLAMSTRLDSVYVNPLKVPDIGVASDILSRILNVDRKELRERMEAAAARDQGYLVVKAKISPEESDRLRDLRLGWIGLERQTQRHYPNDTLAAHLLGFVNFDEEGSAGVEMSMEGLLHGTPGSERVLTDVRRRFIERRPGVEARPGTSLTLTIDERIQFAMERELAKAVQRAGGRTGSAIAMDPKTGRIYGMASYPLFDPNRKPAPGESQANRFNQAVSVPFEPGSVYKVITLTAGLETTSLRPDTIINCGGGTITLFGRTIHESHHGYGSIPMTMVLAKSSNIGAILVGMKVGQPNLYKYSQLFGIGDRTGIELPAESKGRLRKKWEKTSLASVAMGHEVMVTTLQLARACSVIANGGMLVKPTLILRRGNETVPPQPQVAVIRPETAMTMRTMMEAVVLKGTGTKARLDGYTSAGKTGTGKIPDPVTKKYTHFYNATFMGFAPVNNPALVVVVTVNHTRLMGADASAPPYKAITEEALRILNVPKDPLLVAADKNAKPSPERVEEDDAAIADLAADGARLADEDDEETPAVVAAAPAPAVTAAGGPVSASVSAPPVPAGPRVPNFHGKSMRAVVEEASEKGLSVLLDGSGIARMQQPPPGSVLHPGERIRVQFAR
jgi:cell division protein FtsI (penicillin-binding protein 3)